MTMVLGRSFYRNDPISSYRGFSRDSRPMLKMPCSRYSVSLDSGRSYYESAISSHSYDTSSTSTSSSKFTNTVALSTPSPSATANGNKVDFEFEKLRRLSEEWLRNREIEEAENIVLNLRSRSPSPQCSLPPFKYYRRSSSQPSNTVTRDHRSPSPTRSPDRSTRSPSIQKSESPFRSLHSRSPSPLVFSPVSRTFVRSNSYDPDTSRSRSSPPRESSLPPNFSRRTSFFDQEKNYRPSPVRNGSPQRYSPVANIFRRSSSYDAEDAIRSNFRARSTSPQRLTPASSYYRKHSNSEDRDSGIYSSNYNSRSPSPQTSPHSLNLFNRNGTYSTPTSTETKFSHRSSFNNLKNFYGDSGSNKFHSLPRNLFSNRANSPKRESLFDLFTPNTFNRAYTNGGSPNSTSSTSARFNNLFNNLNHNNNNNSFNNSKPPLASSTRHCPAHFLPNTLPDLPSYRMMANTRRYSEEPSPFRRPLATLHEDDVVARRRFSDDLRKKSFETPDVAKELNNHQRKLSEAGVRKHSVPDASLVLTEDTDSFIIGDRVWVGGTKPGSISYIGETQFAPGEWAGVTLDEPIGKNNGSVAGVRYFQCEPKKGVFSRLTRLSRVPLSEHDLEYLASRPAARQSYNSVPKSSTTNAAPTPLERKTSQGIDAARKTSQISEPSRKITPTSPGNKSPLSTKSGSPSPASSVKKAPLPSAGFGSELRIGERVVIDSTTGTKYGVLRYLGRTDFADGVWAGVELDEPTGKNDGSVAGKKYFVCRSKYGLFAPMGRVRSFSNRSSAPRSSLPTMRRSNSKESLGASSAASSNISSLRGTRRPIRTSTSSTSPSTKALQETLEEKTQHVDQLMRERDSDRLEMAKIATRLEETTRIAHDYKMQLDQLQIESEERLHDFGEKVQGMEREKKELLAKLEDKRKEIDDLNFRIEEETFAKADFESQSITTTERIKELEYLLEGEKKKLRERGEKEALKEDEMEEIEISLRTSIEDMQARVMEMERDKENTEKRLEEAEAKKKELETENASLSTSLRENEQRFSLIEAARESIEARAKELETELLRKTQEVARVTGEDSRDIEIAELKAKLKIISDAEELMKKELSGAQDEKQKLQESLTDVNSKVASLEEGKKSLEDELAKASETSKKSLEKITDLETTLTDKNKELEMLQVELEKGKHELTSNKECLQKEQENGKQKEEQNQELQTQLKEAQQKIKELEANTETATAKTSDLSQQVANARLRIEELEKVRRGLESELEVALTSSSATTDQLKEAKAKVEESASRAENEKNELVKEVEKLKEEAEEKEKMLRLLRLEKEGLQEDLENKTKAYEADVKEKDQHRARVEDQLKTQLEEQIKNYKNLSEQFENNSKAFKEEKEALTKEKEQVLADVATLEREKAELSQDKSTKETSLEKSEEMIKILVAEVESLKNQLATYREGLQKQVSLAEEDQKTMAVLRTSLDESQRQLNSLEENLIKTQEEKDESLSAKAALEEETKKLKGLEEKLVKDRERLEEELKELTALRHKNSELEGEKAKLEDDLKRLGAVESERNLEKERNETLTKELEALRILDAGVKALKADKQALEADVSRLNHELSQSKEESQKLTSRCHELEKVSERSAANSEEKSKTQTTMIESLEETKRCLTHELEKTKEELKKINVLEEENADLRRTVEELQKTSQEERICLETSNDALKKSYSEKVSDLETEKGNLVEEVVSLQDRLTNLRQEHETELGKYREKDSAKESEERQLAELRLKTLTLESDKRKLDAEVKMLKEKIALSQIGSGETDEFVVQLKQERDQFEGQLDFLNSVIVDLQKKKEDLETKVEILQSGNLPDDQKANLNGLMGVRAVAPRLFCDICDCFDLHDTEDCPKQTSEDSPPHSHYNADRHTVRAYCDTCEMFGHEDGECPTDETF